MQLTDAKTRLEQMKRSKLQNVEQAMKQGMKGVVKQESEYIKALAFAIKALEGLEESRDV